MTTWHHERAALTAAAIQSEPVAWRWTACTSRGVQLEWQYTAHRPTWLEDEDNFMVEPLYASQPIEGERERDDAP